MKYADVGFRALYRNFAVFPLTPVTQKALKGFPGVAAAEGVLVYGYIDHEAGLTLEVLTPAKRNGEFWRFTNGNNEIRSFIRMEAVAEEEFFLIDNTGEKLNTRYAKKLDMLKEYEVSAEIEKSRTFDFLDDCRHPQYVDDVLVTLLQDGLEPEACWARIIDLSEHRIWAKLLNEPKQAFRIHQGTDFTFYVHQDEETGEVACMARFSPIKRIKREDLADGKELKTYIRKFHEGDVKDALFQIMQILRDCDIWIPCTAVLGEEDTKTVLDMIQEAGDDLDSLKGKTLCNSEKIRMVPDTLKRDGKFYFPVFTTEEEMGEYGKNYSMIQQSFMETIALARNNRNHEEGLTGIVINAFTEPFILPQELYEAVEKMVSRVE